ncbi:hypothetical protein ONZ45_g14482 [Pleurotus djamor]|nr:hypothetical protein ONZ45_g14482 [Pleurotus djamor]
MSPINADVLLEVLRYAEQSDYPALCLVSKIFSEVVCDALYCHFDHPNVVRFCEAVAKYPHLASRVESFEINKYTQLGTPSQSSWFVQEDPLAEKESLAIGTALSLMWNLHTLKLYGDGTYTHILKTIPRTRKLHTFHCHLYTDPEVYEFLLVQTSITDLRLAHASRLDCLPGPHHVPSLHKLEAPLSLAKVLVQGRPIRELRITTHFSGSTLQFLSQSTMPIRSLRAPLGLICALSPAATASLLLEIEELEMNNLVPLVDSINRRDWYADFVSRSRSIKSLTLLGIVVHDDWGDLSDIAAGYLMTVSSVVKGSLKRFTIVLKRENLYAFSWELVNGAWKEMDMDIDIY